MKDFKFTQTRLTRKIKNIFLPEPDLPEKYFPFIRPTRPMQDYGSDDDNFGAYS
jgi:hypothetical protein